MTGIYKIDKTLENILIELSSIKQLFEDKLEQKFFSSDIKQKVGEILDNYEELKVEYDALVEKYRGFYSIYDEIMTDNNYLKQELSRFQINHTKPSSTNLLETNLETIFSRLQSTKWKFKKQLQRITGNVNLEKKVVSLSDAYHGVKANYGNFVRVYNRFLTILDEAEKHREELLNLRNDIMNIYSDKKFLVVENLLSEEEKGILGRVMASLGMNYEFLSTKGNKQSMWQCIKSSDVIIFMSNYDQLESKKVKGMSEKRGKLFLLCQESVNSFKTYITSYSIRNRLTKYKAH